MKKWTLPAAAAVLLAMAWWQWPAVAQRATEPAAAGDMITFDQYREFRARDLQQRQARLARQLADPGLPAAEKASVERRKAYYDRVAAMPAEENEDDLLIQLQDYVDKHGPIAKLEYLDHGLPGYLGVNKGALAAEKIARLAHLARTYGRTAVWDEAD